MCYQLKHSPNSVSATMEMFWSALSRMVATGHSWLLSTWYVANEIKELILNFN